MALSPGTSLGVYEIVALIGAGGMGEVYRARDTKLDRDVAIKVLPEAFAGDPERLARFEREAKTLAALNHPNIGHIYGLEESGGLTALVLELVDGSTLADRIAQGPIPIDEALHIAKQIAEALESAHQHSIVHRDLKPTNINVRPDGTVKVLDFGLAKAMEGADAPSAYVSQALTNVVPTISQPGAPVGTPAYMSPEQVRGEPVVARADIWAFGCVLFEMLTARSPFSGVTLAETFAKVLERDADWQALPRTTPPPIRRLLRNCLQKDPLSRPDIAAARMELEQSQTGRGATSFGMFRKIAVSVAVGTLVVGAWWYLTRSTLPRQPEPVSVVIADVENHTNDPVFNRTLEPFVRLVLEDAPFISAYDRARVSGTLGVRPPDVLNEAAAREIAAKQGVPVVLAGRISRLGSGYGISLHAVQTVTGQLIANEEGRAGNNEQVLGVVTSLVANIRRALGDDTSDSTKLFAMRSISATSLEVVHHYALAVDAQSNGRFQETREHALKAVELDPQFGIGYTLLAAVSLNLGNPKEAEDHITRALAHLDRVTDRERYTIRGMYSRIKGDYRECAKEYGDMTSRYAGDAIARNQRALCLSKLRELREAVDEIGRAVRILPRRPVLRGNLAIYSAYAGDFRAAEREALAIDEPYDLGTLAIAFAQVGDGRLAEASETYNKLGSMSRRAAAWAASGLSDLALYEGRFSDAIRLLDAGVTADMASKNADKAARKLTTLAYTNLMRGRIDAANEAADRALSHSTARDVRFLAARVFAETGAIDKARSVAESLAAELSVEPEAYAKIVEGQIALKNSLPRDAIRTLAEANAVLDTWLGHFELGRAYLAVGAFREAEVEFDRCISRRGEALSLLLDEEPTYGYFPMVHYYRGRGREGLKNPASAESYRAYLSVRGNSNEDPIVADLRRRLQ